MKTLLNNYARTVFFSPANQRQNELLLIKSPLNYTGGKFRLLNQIVPHLPDKISAFYDIFCVGANIGINIGCDGIVCMDNNSRLIELLNFMRQTKEIAKLITAAIAGFGLTNSALYGYAYYNCNSGEGLSRVNKTAYAKVKGAILDSPTAKIIKTEILPIQNIKKWKYWRKYLT